MNLEPTLAQLRAKAPGIRPRIAVVLGSGWDAFSGQLHDTVRIAYADLAGFPMAGVAGHRGELLLARFAGHAVAVLSGRQHAYETGAVDAMALPLRALHAMGCDTLVQTNAAGSLDPAMLPGSLMLVSDHINLPQRSPLVGQVGPQRFVDMAKAYDPELRERAQALALGLGLRLHEGVYLWAMGPQFETPAEIRAFAMLGATAVGMSTVPETIIARHAGMRVLALSLITNMAAGLSDETLSHAHTLAQAQAASERAGAMLAALIQAIATEKDKHA
ncbi:MAG: purine-nucleoside phosphorylase [Betaproteobacteria bacterium]|nr:purine-nucleoside phosphorylase [Betaproteobacteria bacterium]